LTIPVVDLHFSAVERNARAVVQFLAFRLAAVVLRPQPAVVGAVLLPVADHGVLRDGKHLAVQETVAGKIEGIDLNLGVLPGVD
jgi:hypothetical protein